MLINSDIKSYEKLIIDIKGLKLSKKESDEYFYLELMGYAVPMNEWIKLIDQYNIVRINKKENFEYTENIMNQIYNIISRKINSVETFNIKHEKIISLEEILETARVIVDRENTVDENLELFDL